MNLESAVIAITGGASGLGAACARRFRTAGAIVVVADVDVVVADGFSGNIALKTLEGTVRLYSDYLRNAFKSSLASRLGYVLARRGLNSCNLFIGLGPGGSHD